MAGGQQSTVSAGSVAPAASKALAGSAAASGSGSVGPVGGDGGAALTGSEALFSAGTLVASGGRTHGLQITSGQGFLSVAANDDGDSLAGSASTSAAGSAAPARLVRLFSRKTGGGAAIWAPTGQALAVSAGTTVAAPRVPLAGAALTASAGTFARGHAVALTGSVAMVDYGSMIPTAFFRWDAPTSGNATGYRVYWATTAGGYNSTDRVDVGNVLSYPLSSLPLANGTTYFLVCRAYNASGESTVSNEIQVLNGLQIA